LEQIQIPMKDKTAMLLAAAWTGWLATVDSVNAQIWTQTSAPTNNSWRAVASSSDGTRLVAVADEGIYTSTNSGINWAKTTNTPTYNLWCIASSADGAKLVLGTWRNSIFTSTNSGATWTPTDAPYGIAWESVASSADGTKLVAAAAGNTAYISTNSGATWTQTSIYGTAATASADGARFMVSDSTAINISTNSGASWEQIDAPETCCGALIATSADGSKLVAAEKGIYVSTNFGQTWMITSAPTNLDLATNGWRSVASSADGSKLVAVTWNGPIYTSSDSVCNWKMNVAPGRHWQSVACSADGNKKFAVVLGGGIYTYASAPGPVLNLALSGRDHVISWAWPASGFVLQQNADLTTTNWTDVTNTPTVVNQVILSPSSSNVFYRLKW
jgi:hypothetical protein